MNKTNIFKRETKFGQPMVIGHVLITPQSETVHIKRPFFHIIWHRPTALLVEQDGRTW